MQAEFAVNIFLERVMSIPSISTSGDLFPLFQASQYYDPRLHSPSAFTTYIKKIMNTLYSTHAFPTHSVALLFAQHKFTSHLDQQNGQMTRALVYNQQMLRSAKFSGPVYIVTGDESSKLKQCFFCTITATLECLVLAVGFSVISTGQDFFWLIQKFRQQVLSFQGCVIDFVKELQEAFQLLNKERELVKYVYDVKSFADQLLQESRSSELEQNSLKSLLKCENQFEFDKLLKEASRIADQRHQFVLKLQKIDAFQQRLIPCRSPPLFIPFKRQSSNKEKARQLLRHPTNNLQGLEQSLSRVSSFQKKALQSQMKRQSARNEIKELDNQLVITLKKRLIPQGYINWLQSYLKSNYLYIKHQQDSFLVINEEGIRQASVRRSIGDRLICECSFEKRNGIPCQHLTSLLNVGQGGDPIQYFNTFWFSK